MVNGTAGFGAKNRDDAVADGHRAAIVGECNIRARAGAAAGKVRQCGSSRRQQDANTNSFKQGYFQLALDCRDCERFAIDGDILDLQVFRLIGVQIRALELHINIFERDVADGRFRCSNDVTKRAE